MKLQEIIMSLEDYVTSLEKKLKEALALAEHDKHQAENAATINANPFGIDDKDAQEWLVKHYPDEDPCPYNEWPLPVKDQYNNRKELDK